MLHSAVCFVCGGHACLQRNITLCYSVFSNLLLIVCMFFLCNYPSLWAKCLQGLWHKIVNGLGSYHADIIT